MILAKISTLIVILGVMVLSVAVFATNADGAGIVWRAVNKSGSLLSDLANVAGGCTTNQVLRFHSNSTFTCVTLTQGTGTTITHGASDVTITNAGVTSIAGTANNVTMSASTGSVTANLGSNVVVTGGSAQTITKGLTLNSGTLGGSLNANNQRITSLGTPTASTDAEPVNRMGLLGNKVVGTCSDTNILRYQTSNSTWICSTGAALTRISGSSGAAGPDMTWQTLTADAAAITVTTPTVVMTTTGVGTGTWHYKYVVIYTSAATTTGLGIAVNHGGTTTDFVSQWYHITTGGAAATGVGDQVAATNVGQMAEGKAERVKNTVSSASAGVDTINSNMMAVMEGIVVVTASGNLELKVSSEVATSAITVQAGTLLELNKIA